MSDGAALLRRLLSSEVKSKLLVLFHKNPELIDTVEGVARRIGRIASAVDAEVQDLVDLGILRRRSIGRSQVLSLDSAKDKEIQEKTAEYIRSLNGT